MPPTPDLLSTSEAARLIGVSEETVRRWADAGQLPFWRPHSKAHRRFRRSDVEDYKQRAWKQADAGPEKAAS